MQSDQIEQQRDYDKLSDFINTSSDRCARIYLDQYLDGSDPTSRSGCLDSEAQCSYCTTSNPRTPIDQDYIDLSTTRDQDLSDINSSVDSEDEANLLAMDRSTELPAARSRLMGQQLVECLQELREDLIEIGPNGCAICWSREIDGYKDHRLDQCSNMGGRFLKEVVLDTRKKMVRLGECFYLTTIRYR